ncbi:hypothetical protein BGZ60DRAFT_517732 [Tricladium varicosporioides]|nr:hypothetical protein BGZ60DRAFT_517732 [Hymenoscyphus varicosporioides]
MSSHGHNDKTGSNRESKPPQPSTLHNITPNASVSAAATMTQPTITHPNVWRCCQRHVGRDGIDAGKAVIGRLARLGDDGISQVVVFHNVYPWPPFFKAQLL